jgi:carboxyl-terminal processing protease
LSASYQDPYTIFLPPQESKNLREDISGEFSGIGVEIENRAGVLTVVSPLSGTPAARAGVMPKDVIIKIEDIDSTNFSSLAASKLIKGKVGTFVNLEVLRVGEKEPLKIKIKRAIIKIPIVKTYNQDGVFVIKLFSFTENSPELFFEAVREFSKTKNTRLIVDLRGNPGGHLFAAVYISGLFLPEGSKIITQDYGEKKDKDILLSGEYHRSEKTINIFSENVKIGVLVDGGSASASEILAGALNDNNRAVLLGKNTYGKGTVQEVVDMRDKTSLKYTIARWILPSGGWITNKGIPVDIEIEITRDEIEKSREGGSFSEEMDPQLLRAIEQMKKIKTQGEVIEIIKKNRKERKEIATKKRESKIKEILEK